MTLLPRANCSCKTEKNSCAHILEIKHINGMDITDAYKTPNYTELKKKSGRKRRGHKANSKDKPSVLVNIPIVNQSKSSEESDSNELNDDLEIRNASNTIVVDENINELIKELLSKEYEPIINTTIKEKLYFASDMVMNDPIKLSDKFIKPNFNTEILSEYFEKDAWEIVLKLLSFKKKISTCSLCNQLCLDSCIECSACNIGIIGVVLK